MEKLAGDLLLGLKFVRLEICSTSFIDFLLWRVGRIKVKIFGTERVNNDVIRRQALESVSVIPTEFSHIANIEPKLTT